MKKSEQKIIAIYEYLQNYIKENGFPPSYREISSGVGLKSINSVKAYLDILQERGQIKKQSTKNRCIEIIKEENPDDNTILVPLVGNVAAGQPILAQQNIEDYISISNKFFGQHDEKAVFLLRIVGDSMIEAGINSGDYVVVKKQYVAENGEIVVAMIDGNATVKTFYKEKDRIRLQPQNSSYSPIYSDNVEILGKVVGCLKRF